jgi:hypothetical protein
MSFFYRKISSPDTSGKELGLKLCIEGRWEDKESDTSPARRNQD